MSEIVEQRCSQQGCGMPASWSYFWPGDPVRLLACDLCAIKAEAVAGACFHELIGLQILDGCETEERRRGLAQYLVRIGRGRGVDSPGGPGVESPP